MKNLFKEDCKNCVRESFRTWASTWRERFQMMSEAAGVYGMKPLRDDVETSVTEIEEGLFLVVSEAPFQQTNEDRAGVQLSPLRGYRTESLIRIYKHSGKEYIKLEEMKKYHPINPATGCGDYYITNGWILGERLETSQWKKFAEWLKEESKNN